MPASDPTTTAVVTDARALDRRIVALALPALGALLAEPAFLLVDTALVGHLGAAELAGVGIGQAVLSTVVGLLIFLAYATTPAVARRVGAGDLPGAIRAGIDGMWLAALVGLALLLATPLAPGAVGLFGASAVVSGHGTAYLAISMLGIPGMLIALAATGLMRGLQDTRTPLVVAGVGFAANAVLNAVLIYGFELGVAGSALGTVIAQWGMAAFFVWFAVRAARLHGVALAPRLRGVLGTAGSGGWLLLRTASLRIGLLATTFAATQSGTEVLAATQIAFALFSTLAFALDALAIAGQALIGQALGASDARAARAITRRLVRWGVLGGAVVGALLVGCAWAVGYAFTSDAAVLAMLPLALVALGLAQPIAGYVFVLDGVLIGGSDFRYLALTGILNLAAYLPLLALALWVPADAFAWLEALGVPSAAGGAIGVAEAAHLVAIWVAFSFGYMGARAVTLGLRARGSAWVRLGS